MKLKKLFSLITFFVFVLSLGASSTTVFSEANKAEPVVDSTEEKKELPEYSYPPYSIGDRAIIQGYYEPLADGISLNFRVLNNRMYVYWVDADDLIVEPQARAGNVRFLAAVRGKNYYAMMPLQGEDGLGSVGGPVLNPHLFTVILNLEKGESEGFETYTFRHIFAMEAPRETRELDVIESEESEDNKDKEHRGGGYFHNGVVPY